MGERGFRLTSELKLSQGGWPPRCLGSVWMGAEDRCQKFPGLNP